MLAVVAVLVLCDVTATPSRIVLGNDAIVTVPAVNQSMPLVE